MTVNYIQFHRRTAYIRQCGLCFYCRLPMWEKNGFQFGISHNLRPRLVRHLQCTAEHLTARQDGGKDCQENIVAACLWCNRRRHLGRIFKAPSAIEYKVRVERLMRLGRWHPVNMDIQLAIRGERLSEVNAASRK